jgi:hypothetical protein
VEVGEEDIIGGELVVALALAVVDRHVTPRRSTESWTSRLLG